MPSPCSEEERFCGEFIGTTSFLPRAEGLEGMVGGDVHRAGYCPDTGAALGVLPREAGAFARILEVWPGMRVGVHMPRACAWVSVPEIAESKLTGLSGQLVDMACKVCQAYLEQLEHKDIDISKDTANDLTEDEWKDLTQQYYTLIQ